MFIYIYIILVCKIWTNPTDTKVTFSINFYNLRFIYNLIDININIGVMIRMSELLMEQCVHLSSNLWTVCKWFLYAVTIYY